MTQVVIEGEDAVDKVVEMLNTKSIKIYFSVHESQLRDEDKTLNLRKMIANHKTIMNLFGWGNWCLPPEMAQVTLANMERTKINALKRHQFPGHK